VSASGQSEKKPRNTSERLRARGRRRLPQPPTEKNDRTLTEDQISPVPAGQVHVADSWGAVDSSPQAVQGALPAGPKKSAGHTHVPSALKTVGEGQGALQTPTTSDWPAGQSQEFVPCEIVVIWIVF